MRGRDSRYWPEPEPSAPVPGRTSPADPGNKIGIADTSADIRQRRSDAADEYPKFPKSQPSTNTSADQGKIVQAIGGAVAV